MVGYFGDIMTSIVFQPQETIVWDDVNNIFKSHAFSNFSGSYNDLTDKPATPGVRSFNNAATHSLVTGTGATGFQVSSTRDTSVNYNVTSSTTATIGGASTVTVFLEVAPTNSATAGDWVEISRFSNGQTITLAVALQSVQTAAGNLGGVIPAGYYAKLRTVTSGTASSAYVSGQEVLI